MRVIEVNEDWLEQTAVLFNGYRKFYKQEGDFEKSKQFIKNRIDNKESVIFIVLVDGDNPAGFVQLYPVFSSISCKKDYILNDLFVVKEYRRRGLATLLLEKAKLFAHEKGSKGLALETAKSNPARKLYEKLGWHSDQEYVHYYWKTNSYPKVEQKFINKDIGFGVFALTDIKKGDLVLVGKSVYKTNIRDHKTLQINDVEHSRLDTPFENTNHSCNPNSGVKENEFDGYNLIALNDIKKGEQVTMDYCATEWESTLGLCFCGAIECRKNIKGAKYLSDEDLGRYDGLIANYIKIKRNL